MIHTGNAIDVLQTLPDQSVQCCVTSPPYWGLRDYGVPGQYGMEPTPEEYVANMVAVFAEVRRVLRDDGTTWINLGDNYYSDFGGGSGTCTTGNKKALQLKGRSKKHPHPILKKKDLCGIPWAVAKALQEPLYKCQHCGYEGRESFFGKFLNGKFSICPHCAKRHRSRQPTKVSDGWYLRQDIIWSKPAPTPESVTDRCTKSHEYIFLLSKKSRYYYDADAVKEPAEYAGKMRGGSTNRYEQNAGGMDNKIYDTRNLRSVWTINTQGYPGTHFATFPEALPERCIKAGSKPGDTVLDPFAGAGTTLMVAARLDRVPLGIELNPEYVKMAIDRINKDRKPNTYRSDGVIDSPLFTKGDNEWRIMKSKR